MDTWQASLELEFLQNRQGKTIMSRNLHYGPLMVQRPFYQEEVCHVYLLHPPGGVAFCDNLSVKATAFENSHCLITTPGATKFYKSNGRQSLFTQEFVIKDHASLEFLPAQNIYYKGTNTKVTTAFYLEGEAKFAFRDVSKCGMKDETMPFEHSSLFNRILVYKNQKLVLNETCFIDGMDDYLSKAAINNHPYLGTYMSNALSLDLIEYLAEHLKHDSYTFCLSNVDDIFIARFLGDDNQSIEKAIVKLWLESREQVIGFKPSIPRIWST